MDNWSKFQINSKILKRVISILVISQKTHLRVHSYGQTLIFLKLQTKISQERKKIFEFRKKGFVHVKNLVHISQACKNTLRPPPPPPPPIALTPR